jgi:hypothetical protein
VLGGRRSVAAKLLAGGTGSGHYAPVSEVGRRKRAGWLLLAAIASFMAVGAVLDAMRRLAHSDLVGLVTLSVALTYWYWIGVGAWRRAGFGDTS